MKNLKMLLIGGSALLFLVLANSPVLIREPARGLESSIEAGFFRDLIKAITGAFDSLSSSGNSGSGSSESSGSGSGNNSNVYVPSKPVAVPAQPQVVGLGANVNGMELPNSSTPKIAESSCILINRDVAGNKNPRKLVDQGSNMVGEPVFGAPLAEATPLTDLEALQKNGEKAQSPSASFQVFVPTNSETEMSCFRGTPKSIQDELSLTIALCPPPPAPSSGGIWVNVAGSGESQAAACARIKSVPYTEMDSCGICAAAESRPMDSCGNAATITWPAMPAKYAAYQGGGGQVSSGDTYCYKKLPWGSWDQKQDNDSTDRIVAWRCVDPTPPPKPKTESLTVNSDCSKIE